MPQATAILTCVSKNIAAVCSIGVSLLCFQAFVSFLLAFLLLRRSKLREAFSSNMVLQRNKPVPVWAEASR